MPNQPVGILRRVVRIVKWAAAILAILFLAVLTIAIVQMVRGPRIVEHVGAADAPYDVPADATDVCYSTSVPFYPWWAWEFAVSETSFVRWAEAQGLHLEEQVDDDGWEITRYNGQDAAIIKGVHGWQSSATDPDSGLMVGYDRQRQRAYAYRCTR
jgi:hypothetical protein